MYIYIYKIMCIVFCWHPVYSHLHTFLFWIHLILFFFIYTLQHSRVGSLVYSHLQTSVCFWNTFNLFVFLHSYDVLLWAPWPMLFTYGVATISRLLENVGLFNRILSLLESSCAKETYCFCFKEPNMSVLRTVLRRNLLFLF